MAERIDRSVCVSKWGKRLIVGFYWREDTGAGYPTLKDCTIEDTPITMMESTQEGINKFFNHKPNVVFGDDALYAMAFVDPSMFDLFDMVVSSENPAQALISRQVLTAKAR